MKNSRTALLGVLVLTGGLLSQAAWGKGFMKDRPWLAQRSVWSEKTPGGGNPRGWWCVGNGRVFGIVGPGLSQAFLGQITGPHIMLAGVMQNASAFGPATLRLTVAGKPVRFTSQELSKVRGTNIVVMEYDGPQVKMTVLNYAPFNVNALLRTVIVENKGNAALNNVVLTATVNRTTLKDGRLFNSFKGAGGIAMGQTRQLFSSFLEPCKATGPQDKPGRGVLTTQIGMLPPGNEAVKTQYLLFSMKEVGDEAKTLATIQKQKTALLKKAYDDWHKWLATTTRVQCPDQRLIDLLDDTKMLVRIQTADPQIAAGPMEFFAGVWVRDSNGPFLYYLRMGRLDMAKKMLDFYYRASAKNKRIANWVPMDIDVSKPVPADFDWSAVSNDPVEIPSWLILQHKWYYNYSGDLETIRKHWGYLKRCLYGHLYDVKGNPFRTIEYALRVPSYNKLYRFPHHGDETWIYPGFEVLNSAVFPEPNDHPHWDSFSADSTWEFVASADAMAHFAGLLGDKAEAAKMAKLAKDSRAALERDYWMAPRGLYAPAMNMRSGDVHQPPFTMVNFNPLWIGYHKGRDPKAISNVLETMKYTLNPNYVTDATETLRVYVGMQPGMFLYNLSAIDHPFAAPALKAMMNIASPSGEYTEKHVTDPKSYRSHFLGHRIRPWEGGINMDAAYFYLTGLEPDVGSGRILLCPRMLAGWKKMSVTGQSLANGKLDIHVTDDGSQRTYKVTWKGAKPLQAGFKVSLPQAKITSVKVDGRAVAVKPQSKWGVMTAMLKLPLPVGKAVTVTADYEKQAVALPKVVRERYKYIVPKNVPSYQVILWDNERRKGNLKDLRIFDYLKKAKVNYRLIGSFNPASPAWLRPFLLKGKGKVNTPLFVMSKSSITGSLKYAKWWGAKDLSKLFTEYMQAGGIIVTINTLESSSSYFGDLFGDSVYSGAPSKEVELEPVGKTGKAACELLGLVAGEKYQLKSKRMYTYKNMVVLACPATEKAAAVVLAKKFGKGFFLAILAENASYEKSADVIQKLAHPQVQAKLKQLIGAAKPTSMPGAFKDFSKNNSFADDFSKYKDGSAGLPVWQPIHGTWSVKNGEYHQTQTNGYDFCSAANAKIVGDYKVETKVRLVKGIMEGGYLFNLPSRFSKGASQMARFCGYGALWCGTFSGSGVFTLQNNIPTGLSVNDKGWVTLTVTVNNSKGTYDLAVNGKQVAKGLKLTHIPRKGEGCYVGLVACRGHIAYDYIKVTPLKR